MCSSDLQPGDYRALLPNDAVGRWALRVDEPAPAALEFRVNLPPQHELEVAGTSILGLMMLTAATGSVLRLTATGPQAAAALEALADLVARGFDEE